MSVHLVRAGERFVTRSDGTVTYHSFSFGAHYDPDNVGFGALLAHNDEVVPPGTGYDWHRHAGVELVTYVVEGALLHEDRLGHRAVTPAGSLQVLSAGCGVEHAERSADARPVRFVQAWLSPAPAASPGPPVYRALGAADRAVPPRQPDAHLRVLHLAAEETVQLPAAPRVHAFVAVGTVSARGAGVLEPGDTLRVAGDGPLTLSAGAPADVLVWLLGTPSGWTP